MDDLTFPDLTPDQITDTDNVQDAVDAVIKVLVERADALHAAGKDATAFVMATGTLAVGKMVAAFAYAEGGSDEYLERAIEKMVSGIRLSAHLHAAINRLIDDGLVKAPASAEEAA